MAIFYSSERMIPIFYWFVIKVFKTKAGQIGITNLQLIDCQYLESLVFLQVVFNVLFSNR